MGRTDDIVLPTPDVDVDGVEDAKEREAPGDGVDDHALSGREELVDDCAEKEQMNERPVETHSVSHPHASELKAGLRTRTRCQRRSWQA